MARCLLHGVLVRGQAPAVSPSAATSGYASPSLVPQGDSPGFLDFVSGRVPSPGILLWLSPQIHLLWFAAESPAQESGTGVGYWPRCPAGDPICRRSLTGRSHSLRDSIIPVWKFHIFVAIFG